MAIPRDVQEFLDAYPDVEDDPAATANLEFYSNKHRCRPDNCTIEEIHETWLGDYDKLEFKHGYIQWLFPIREYGMNYESQPLQTHEIQKMKADPAVVERVFESYRLMLDFYGMRLVSTETGLVDRALPPRNFEARYRNLARESPPFRSKIDPTIHRPPPSQGASHNNLRISRILKCLSEMGLERLNAGFLLHVLAEQSEFSELNSWGIRSSMDRWWANCLRNEEERAWIRDLIRRVRLAEDGYVFTRDNYEKILKNRAETGELGLPQNPLGEQPQTDEESIRKTD
ncbi:unnamed protein product [Cyclocybe aegerita]|uniref:Opioid growth factor receptor (OGFr) conserved domain-containing protein n=1 Tax=Cyclocybe aegerita TaxID=1973307 RepID=A0A8S0W8M8_CYCAE|nr:unnamed protein product [Cyclocybe aegerita]